MSPSSGHMWGRRPAGDVLGELLEVAPLGYTEEACEEHARACQLGGEDGFGEEARQCRVCGCTDDDCRGCVERTGRPCHWVEWDLCSACAGAGRGASGTLLLGR